MSRRRDLHTFWENISLFTSTAHNFLTFFLTCEYFLLLTRFLFSHSIFPTKKGVDQSSFFFKPHLNTHLKILFKYKNSPRPLRHLFKFFRILLSNFLILADSVWLDTVAPNSAMSLILLLWIWNYWLRIRLLETFRLRFLVLLFATVLGVIFRNKYPYVLCYWLIDIIKETI